MGTRINEGCIGGLSLQTGEAGAGRFKDSLFCYSMSKRQGMMANPGAARVCVLMVLLLYAGGVSADHAGFVKPSPKDKCPVCGMFVAKYPDFTAEIVFKDGSYAVFDGAKDMFKYYLDLKRFNPARTPGDIRSIYVTGYYDLQPADATRAFYVIGSDVYGPMGRELIPFVTEGDAMEFLKDHAGRQVLRFGDITADVVKGLE
jgi:nitrous oxide reductase accessory protein NosL